MQTVGLLTDGIIHELNNFLVVVVGNFEMLQERILDDDAVERSAAMALKRAIRGAELTQSLLNFLRKQTLASVNLNELIMGLWDMLQRTLVEQSTLDTVLAENLPDISADKRQIEGALLNLVLNARDASANGGAIIIRTFR